MVDLIKCYCCGNIVVIEDCKKIADNDIVTCLDENKKILHAFCWNCNLRPTNSQECLNFIEIEKKNGKRMKQYTKKEYFR